MISADSVDPACCSYTKNNLISGCVWDFLYENLQPMHDRVNYFNVYYDIASNFLFPNKHQKVCNTT